MFPTRSERNRFRLTGRRVILAIISLTIVWITLDLLIFNMVGIGTLSDVEERKENAPFHHLRNINERNTNSKHSIYENNRPNERVNRSKLHNVIFGSHSKLLFSHEKISTLSYSTKRIVKVLADVEKQEGHNSLENNTSLSQNIFSRHRTVNSRNPDLSSVIILTHIASTVSSHKYEPRTEKSASDKIAVAIPSSKLLKVLKSKNKSHASSPGQSTLSTLITYTTARPTMLLSANMTKSVSNKDATLVPSSSITHQVNNTVSIIHEEAKKTAFTNTTIIAKTESERNNEDHSNPTSDFISAEGGNHLRPVHVKDIDNRKNSYDLSDLGENGRAVIVNKSEDSLVEDSWSLASFNQYVSDKISFERSIPDTRNPLCKLKTYIYPLLPKTSIIICFTEESWSTLIRTVISILNRTPPELLAEIILVDDFSQRDHLKQQLVDFVKDFPIIKLIRLKSRSGLIRARLIAIEQAIGPVITLLDSHVECNKGWLEPLLEAIRNNRRTIASPIIDIINATTFEYIAAPDTVCGSFDWGLEFQWTQTIPPHEMKRRIDPTTEIRTATVAGGLLSMDKQFFYELGAYDPNLEIWGAENIELSFKTWMCGGSLEIHPCSRVGHVFRDSQPYSIPGTRSAIEVFLRNSKRVAEVWMDDYKKLFYRYNPSMLNVDVGDTSSRNEIKERLQCHNFEWFLNEVAPEIYRPSLFPEAWGSVMNLANGKCLNMLDSYLVLSACEGNPDFMFFQLTTDNKIETFVNCIGFRNDAFIAVGSNEIEHVMKFSHKQSGDQIVELRTNKCLTVKTNTEADQTVEMELLPCASERLDQKWSFEKYRNDVEI